MKLAFVSAILSALVFWGGSPASPAENNDTPYLDVAPENVIRDVCTTCHDDLLKVGNLSLQHFDVSAPTENAETAEKIIRKLRAGMMPPAGQPRPNNETLTTLVTLLEDRVDEVARQHPDPGGRTFQRLNRPEYERAIFDLLGLKVDASDWLPEDTMAANFDNIAAAQTLSPLLLESYLNAAADIARMAVGNRNATLEDVTYSNPIYVSQHPWDHVEGAPYGTRGGIVVDHVFPADGEYQFGASLVSGNNSRLEDIDVSINRERVALIPYTKPEIAQDGRGAEPLWTEPVFVRAGQHSVSVAFVRRSDGPYEDLIRPHDWSFAGGGAGGPGITTLPHLQHLLIRGPRNVTGLSQTVSRERIFTCRPTDSSEERPCAEEILGRLGEEAYRRPLNDNDVKGLMQFYDIGSDQGGFEIGIRTALEAMLASPNFVLRLERTPEGLSPGQTYRISDLDLASRLSFFLWGTPPDEELQALANQGKLSAPEELERQARRLLADPRADALGTRFAYQWFRLQDLYKVHPDPNYYPNFDENLADAMVQETELFFNHLVRADRSFFELFKADYTFLNERLARHYEIPHVAGPHFRKVAYPDDHRRGILGHGSVLVLTSLANRTSPVLRGKWVMEVLMGTPPPPPPPNVPALEATAGAKEGHLLTTRERMEMHRQNPACQSCHRMIDPIGLALDNFDPTAKWRQHENGMPLDTSGTFYDGTSITNPQELIDTLLKRPEPLARTFTENLLAYAIGRKIEYFDQPTIRAIVQEAANNEYRMSSFILGVVKSVPFQQKRVEAAPEAPAVSEH